MTDTLYSKTLLRGRIIEEAVMPRSHRRMPEAPCCIRGLPGGALSNFLMRSDALYQLSEEFFHLGSGCFGSTDHVISVIDEIVGEVVTFIRNYAHTKNS